MPCKKSEIDDMIVFDFLISNSGRHFGNFGFIRDTESLPFQRLAPLFDHGNSLWYQDLTYDVLRHEQKAKPFRELRSAQIELVTEATLPIEKLLPGDLHAILAETLQKNPRMDEERVEKIVRGTQLALRDLCERKERGWKQRKRGISPRAGKGR